MCFTSNCYGAFLNKACAVILFEGLGNAENFSLRTWGTVLKTKGEDFVPKCEDSKS